MSNKRPLTKGCQCDATAESYPASPKRPPLQVGDRVRVYFYLSSSDGEVFDYEPGSKRIGVRFDKPIEPDKETEIYVPVHWCVRLRPKPRAKRREWWVVVHQCASNYEAWSKEIRERDCVSRFCTPEIVHVVEKRRPRKEPCK